MTDAALIALALAPRLPVALIQGVSWEKVCLHCSWYNRCEVLNLAGLPLRCARVDDEEREMLREALRCASSES